MGKRLNLQIQTDPVLPTLPATHDNQVTHPSISCPPIPVEIPDHAHLIALVRTPTMRQQASLPGTWGYQSVSAAAGSGIKWGRTIGGLVRR